MSVNIILGFSQFDQYIVDISVVFNASVTIATLLLTSFEKTFLAGIFFYLCIVDIHVSVVVFNASVDREQTR